MKPTLLPLCTFAVFAFAAEPDPAQILREANSAGAKLKTAKYSVEADMGSMKVRATIWQENADVPDIGLLHGRFRIKGSQVSDGETSFFEVAYDGRSLRIKNDGDQIKSIENPTGYEAGQNIPAGAMLASVPLMKHRFGQASGTKLKMLAAKKVGAWQCDVVEVRRTVNNPAVGDVELVTKLSFDKESHLLVQIDSARGKSTVTKLELNPKIEKSFFRMETSLVAADPLGPMTSELLPLGSTMPSFSVVTPEGVLRQSSHYRGKVLVLDFWATYCVPCRKMMPALEELHKEYAKHGVEVLGISLDTEMDPVRMMRQLGHSYPIAVKGDGASKAFKVKVLPTIYVIDPKGMIVYRSAGVPENGPTQLIEVVKSLVAAQNSAGNN